MKMGFLIKLGILMLIVGGFFLIFQTNLPFVVDPLVVIGVTVLGVILMLWGAARDRKKRELRAY